MPTFRLSPTPNFSSEGTAVNDCLNPDRIVIGGESPEAFRMMRRLYDPLVKREEDFITMNWESAELTKYAANSMLAARISFMNEMTILCEHYGADIEDIRKGIGIGLSASVRHSSGPGAAMAGPASRKTWRRMEHICRHRGPRKPLRARDADRSTRTRRNGSPTRSCRSSAGRSKGAKIAVWGLAFKADTDDIRESAALDVIRYLLDKGAHVVATDPKAMENMKQIFKDEVEWSPDPVHAAVGADAVALLTDWPQYSTLPFRKIAATMNQPIIFDGRNCLHRDVMRETGFQYYPMGRPAVENTLRLKQKV